MKYKIMLINSLLMSTVLSAHAHDENLDVTELFQTNVVLTDAGNQVLTNAKKLDNKWFDELVEYSHILVSMNEVFSKSKAAVDFESKKSLYDPVLGKIDTYICDHKNIQNNDTHIDEKHKLRGDVCITGIRLITDMYDNYRGESNQSTYLRSINEKRIKYCEMMLVGRNLQYIYSLPDSVTEIARIKFCLIQAYTAQYAAESSSVCDQNEKRISQLLKALKTLQKENPGNHQIKGWVESTTHYVPEISAMRPKDVKYFTPQISRYIKEKDNRKRINLLKLIEENPGEDLSEILKKEYSVRSSEINNILCEIDLINTESHIVSKNKKNAKKSNITQRRADTSVALGNGINLIEQLENFVAEKLNVAVDDSERLQKIYAQYMTVADQTRFEADLLNTLGIFLHAGDVQGALLRVQATSSLVQKHPDGNCTKLQAVMAFIKNLNGDFADWLAIEEHAQKMQEQQQLKIAQKKQALRADTVAEIQQHVAIKTIEQTAEEAEREKKALRNKRKKERQKANRAATAATSDNSMDDSIPTVLTDAKALKLKNHADNERLRQERSAAAVISNDSAPLAVPLVSEKANDGIQRSTDIIDPIQKQQFEQRLSNELSVHYSLSGVALEVNNKIQNGAWNFTRENLESYYIAMGCVKKQGKGSHEKIKLPDSVVFSNGDEIITIINEMGGSLTLPLWKDVVPSYLRKQIQMARENLRELTKKA